MNIGILGSSGFVGTHCALHLEQQGLKVQRYGRGDLIGKHDVILHLAQPSRLESSVILNDIINEHCAKIKSLTNKCQLLVYISSAAIYGNQYQIPVNESILANPIDNYGKFKLASEKCVLENFPGNKSLIIRPSNIFGKGMHRQTIVGDYLEQIKAGKMSIKLRKAYPVRDFIHITDFIYGLLALLNHNQCGIYNISSGIPTSIKDLTKIMDQHFGSKAEFDELTSMQSDYLVLDPSKLESTTKWKKPKEFSDKFCYYLQHEIN